MFELSLDTLYPLVQALGWALVHFCWQGALIAAIYAAGSLLLRESAPTMRYLFGLVNMTAMGLAPILTIWVLYPSSATTAEPGAVALLAAQVGASSFQAGGITAGFEIEPLDFLQVSRCPICNAISNQIDKCIGQGNRP